MRETTESTIINDNFVYVFPLYIKMTNRRKVIAKYTTKFDTLKVSHITVGIGVLDL